METYPINFNDKEKMITLKIYRKWSLYGAANSLKIFIDGEQAEKISCGQTKTFTLEPGNHLIEIVGMANYRCALPMEISGEDGEIELLLRCAISSLSFLMFGFLYILFCPEKAFVLQIRRNKK